MSVEILPKWDEPAIRVLMMPRDTNPYGTIFGGVILSYIDVAGAVGAQQGRILSSDDPRGQPGRSRPGRRSESDIGCGGIFAVQ